MQRNRNSDMQVAELVWDVAIGKSPISANAKSGLKPFPRPRPALTPR
jgi:hypothetical protein